MSVVNTRHTVGNLDVDALIFASNVVLHSGVLAESIGEHVRTNSVAIANKLFVVFSIGRLYVMFYNFFNFFIFLNFF